MNNGINQSFFFKFHSFSLSSQEYSAVAVLRRPISVPRAAGSSNPVAAIGTRWAAAWKTRCRKSRGLAASLIYDTRQRGRRRRVATGSNSISTRWSTGIAETGIIPSGIAGSEKADTGTRRSIRHRRRRRTASSTGRPPILTGREKLLTRC